MHQPAQRKIQTGGFTLMELVIVMAVITILVGMALPSLSGYARQAEQMEREDHQELIQKALRQYYAYEGDYPDVDDLDADAGAAPLTQDQADQLRDLLDSVTTARLNTADYTCRYDEGKGSIVLASK